MIHMKEKGMGYKHSWDKMNDVLIDWFSLAEREREYKGTDFAGNIPLMPIWANLLNVTVY